MELHYYKNIFEEGAEYLTWEFICVDVLVGGDVVGGYEKGWTKKKVPNFTSSQELEAVTYFSVSNAEDKHFIEMERLYCNAYLDKELKEIDISEENNQKIIKSCTHKRPTY